MITEKVIFTNSRGQSIELTDRRPFLLQSVEGKNDVSASVQTQTAPFQDGGTYVDSMLQIRPLALNVTIHSSTQEELINLRQLFSSVFNPKLGLGKLVYSKGNTVREIEATVENIIMPVGKENNGMRFQRSVVNLLCPTAFFEDVNVENYKLEDFVGSFKFPFTLPTRFSTRGDSKVLANYGDVPTPIEVEFRGPVTNPVITNESTGEFIRINRAIPVGYKLILDTSFGNKRVEIIAPDGTTMNGFHFIDLQSTFFALDTGDNRIGFVAEGGSPEVYIRYKHRYLSV